MGFVETCEFAIKWFWYDPFPLPNPKCHWEQSVQRYRRDKFLRALEWVWVIGFYGHSNKKSIGGITARDLIQQYRNWWKWDPKWRSWRRQFGLSHIRLAVIIGCYSGGEGPDRPEVIPDSITRKSEPALSSVAGALWRLGVKAVVFTDGAVGDKAAAAFNEQFWSYLTKGWDTGTLRKDPNKYKSRLSAQKAVELAIKRLSEGRLPRDRVGIKRIWIVGNTLVP